MTPHQTLAVIVRLAAIWLFLYAISTMVGTYTEAHQYSAPDSLKPIFLGVGVISLICLLLWFFPFFIAKRILPTSMNENAQTTVFDSWFSVGCSLIGVFELAKAIPALTFFGLGNYLGHRLWPDSFVISPDLAQRISFYTFQIVIGIWLFMGGKGLKKLLRWARNV
jgi:uncharacterized membrane-anchored protein